ncbi:hypothetical protein [Amycolatopsis jejuensis]|uniref:hypothetical protein n=1 Tax=Amycolatopsis jejuensis TaxID=330084 RepID=UPI0005265A99|nr:hypothetical protein [Amycolatopsis jejuensis]
MSFGSDGELRQCRELGRQRDEQRQRWWDGQRRGDGTGQRDEQRLVRRVCSGSGTGPEPGATECDAATVVSARK